LEVVIQTVEVIIGAQGDDLEKAIGDGTIGPLLNNKASQARGGIGGHIHRHRNIIFSAEPGVENGREWVYSIAGNGEGGSTAGKVC